jgi:hypothetical protein
MSLLSTVGSIFTKALPWVSAGLGLLSTVKSYQGASALEKQAGFNAEVWRDEAAASWRSYQDKAQILRNEQRLFNQTQTANYAKSGVTLEGTPMEVLNDFIYRQSLDQHALYDTAVAEDKRRKTEAANAIWQAHGQANAMRTQALSNFGATLINSTGRVNYGAPWTPEDDAAVTEAATATPRRVTRPNYSRAQANAVPGGAGWRPVTAAR